MSFNMLPSGRLLNMGLVRSASIAWHRDSEGKENRDFDPLVVELNVDGERIRLVDADAGAVAMALEGCAIPLPDRAFLRAGAEARRKMNEAILARREATRKAADHPTSAPSVRWVERLRRMWRSLWR